MDTWMGNWVCLHGLMIHSESGPRKLTRGHRIFVSIKLVTAYTVVYRYWNLFRILNVRFCVF